MCVICRGTISGCPECDPDGAYERREEERPIPSLVIFIFGTWAGAMGFALLATLSPF
jgi:hypothetical protein